MMPTESDNRRPRLGKTFLIHPVRGHPSDTYAEIVLALEQQGWEVWWPARDTNQDDHTGYRICLVNLEAIRHADLIHVIWDGQSQGCLFDLGMAFALNKQTTIIKIPTRLGRKSFQDMLGEWAMTAAAEAAKATGPRPFAEAGDLAYVATADGKYTVIQRADGGLFYLRHGEPWNAANQEWRFNNLIAALSHMLDPRS